MISRPLLACLTLSVVCLFECGCSPAGPVEAKTTAVRVTPTWPDDLITVSGPMSPPVRYGLKREGDDLLLVIEATAFNPSGEGVAVQAGLSADQVVTLTDTQANITRNGDRASFRFIVPAARLMRTAGSWNKLRLAFSVEWAGGPNGLPRQRERFLHVTPGAPHAGLSARTEDWKPVDLAELEREAADRASQIVIDFTQPIDGKATVVIEGADGHRVRNLLAGKSMSKGHHRLVWDGLDEAGIVAPPGRYTWRSISHPGLRPVHQMDFFDAPGSNHGTMESAAFNGRSLFFAAPLAEGGHELVELTPDGDFVRGFNLPHGHGLMRVLLACDADSLYIAHDGVSWIEKVDRTKPNWVETRKISVARLDLKTGTVFEFPDKQRYAFLKRYDMGPGATTKLPFEKTALAGFAALKGRLYVADAEAGQVLVVDPASGKVERTFPLKSPVALAVYAGGLHAIADGKLVDLDPVSGALTTVAALPGLPSGLTGGPDGRIYVSDTKDHVVRVFDAAGKPAGVIGTPGGVVRGPYDPLRLHNPAGTAVAAGRIWITEHNRWEPKRLAAFNLQTGRVEKELFGPTNYGAQDAGFDYADHTRWIGQGTLFELDFEKHTSRPLAILGGKSGRRHTFWRQDGRTFVITSGKATYIQELRADGTLRPLACLSSAHQFAYDSNWNPPQTFVDAFMRDYPGVKIKAGQVGGIERIQPNHGYGMLWVDRSGDGEMQADEIEFSTAASNLGGSGWSHDFHDLTLRIPGEISGRKVLVTLKPDGWWPGGAPKYPALNDAVRAGVPIDLPGSNQVESAVDRFGNTVLNSSPDMRAFAPDGRLLWTYPNKWSGVHGSHDAPLPVAGQMQGSLFFSGMVPLDDKSDVMLLNGNHGRAFLLTSDGLYIDEIFPDVRLMTNPQGTGIGILGGECFGGTFGRSEKDGNYYFQGGGISYRIYRVDGLKDIHRGEGSLVVNAAQAAAAERNLTRRVVEKTGSRQAVVPRVATAPVIDGADRDWSGPPTVTWKSGDQFTVTVRAATDDTMLYLHYTVRDDSPWVNNGKDWQALFKTGDGVDLQLGTDPSANPKRTGPVPGDLRLFIAPSNSGNVAVLYRHRVTGAKEAEGVVFQSPWRSEKVDVVRRLDNARTAVQQAAGVYRVEVAVPLADLELGQASGRVLRGDFGVIYGDAAGTVNVFRNYWSNPSTGLVNDVPGEIMLTPGAWGELTFGASAGETSKEIVK